VNLNLGSLVEGSGIGCLRSFCFEKDVMTSACELESVQQEELEIKAFFSIL
jgi:hypothetical protein